MSLDGARFLIAPRPRKLVVTMGDKSPKNARKSIKQKTDAKTAKFNKKHEPLLVTPEHPAAD